MEEDNLIFVCELMDVFKTVDFHVLQPVRCVCGMMSCALFLTSLLQETSKVPGWSNSVCHRRLVHFTFRCVCVSLNQYPGQ